MTPEAYAFLIIVGGFIWLLRSTYNLAKIYYYNDVSDSPANVARAVLWPVFFVITLIVGTIHASYFAIKDAFHFRR
jgi:hypothetical protein